MSQTSKPRDTLELSDGTKLEWLDKSAKIFINKMTIIYGPSGSGKTTVLNEIMYVLKPYMPSVWVISPTNFANKMFVGRIPSHCIKSGIDEAQTIHFLEKLIEHQRNISNIYEMANDITILRSIFGKIFDTRARALANQITIDAENSIRSTHNMPNLNIAERKTKIVAITKTRDTLLRKIFKISIVKHKETLSSAQLTKQEKIALKFIKINPRCLLILDDCASRIKGWVKKSNTIKQIFYEFRNYHGTTCITAQNDKEIDSEYRKNAMVNIFTDDQSAVSNFTRASNSYGKATKTKALACIDAVFSQKPGKPKHFQKLVYFNNNPNPFRFIQADLYPDFRMGSNASWEFSKKISERDEEKQESNPYFDKYC